MAGRRGKGSHVTQVGQVNARGDQSAAVSQDAEAHHAQGAAGVSHELEELIPDSLTEAQSAEGKGNDGGEKGQGHHQVVLSERGRDPRGKEHCAHDEEGQDAQRMAEQREAEADQNDIEPEPVGGGHGLELRHNQKQSPVSTPTRPWEEPVQHVAEDGRQQEHAQPQRDPGRND